MFERPSRILEEIVHGLNELRARGALGDCAIAGAFAFIYHSEPFETKDLDIMAVLPESPSGLIDLAPIWSYFTERGARPDGQFLRFGPVLLDLVPTSDALDEEAVREAEPIEIGAAKTRVLTAEHAIAVAVRTDRPRDRTKIALLLATPRRPIDFGKLDAILSRHGLFDRWRALRASLGSER